MLPFLVLTAKLSCIQKATYALGGRYICVVPIQLSLMNVHSALIHVRPKAMGIPRCVCGGKQIHTPRVKYNLLVATCCGLNFALH